MNWKECGNYRTWIAGGKPYSKKKRQARKARKQAIENTKKNQRKAQKYSRGLGNKPTPAEKELIQALQDIGIRFKFQRPVYDHSHCYIIDFWIFTKSAPLVVEIDGESHKNRAEYDFQRTVFLQNKRNCKVIRFKNEQVFNDLTGIVRAIKFYEPLYHENRMAI